MATAKERAISPRSWLRGRRPPVPRGDGDRLRVLVLVTRGEAGGAQIHVRDLMVGLRQDVDFHLAVGHGGSQHDVFLERELRPLGIPVHTLPELQRDIGAVSDLRAMLAVRRVIQQVRPDIVHTHSTKAGLIGRCVARVEGVPAIHTAHGWIFSDGSSLARRVYSVPLEALAGRWTDRFIVVSDADREVGMRYGVVRRHQVHVVHNGIIDAPERARPGADGTPVVTMVARMSAPKDFDLLLRALAGVRVPFRAVFVGDGPDRPAIEDTVGRLGLQDRVELLGYRLDLPEILAASQVFVLASRHEGFPLSVLEGMRAGLPVVASDVGGIHEAVQHDVSGLLVARDDERGLREALERVLSDPAERVRMGEAGRKLFEARFTVDHMLSGAVATYFDLARARGLPLPGTSHLRVPQ